MKYLYLLLSIVLFASCSDTNLTLNEGNFSTVKFRIINNDNNHQAKIRTVFLESGFFKFDGNHETNVFPFEESYASEINFAANLGLEYEDLTVGDIGSYTITVQMIRDNILIREKLFTITTANKKISFDAVINK
ncbi:hypothetical protein [Tenacibaculum sp. 190524A02b]|uniref:DUF4625 domain-containing protein n=1 Tax=Tenacibaculum vairaonense TaxID=3137860 RepID=A0ABP1FCH7_9FLAO